MKKTITILATLMLIVNFSYVQAKTMKIIAFCNTLDDKIGKAAVVSHDMMNNELSDIAYMLGYEKEIYSYAGTDCTKENLEKAIREVSSSPEDILIFYYFGHGTRAKDQISPFPQMCLKYEGNYEDKFMPAQYVINNLAKQPAHLKFIMTACCNSPADWVTPKNELNYAMSFTQMSGVNIENYKKLFDDFSGTIAITSSKPGQYSWCTSSKGGFFDASFWDVMSQVGSGNIKGDWNTVLNAAKSNTDELAYKATQPHVNQEPYFEINPLPYTPKRDNDGWNDNRGREYNPRTNDDLQNAMSDMIANSDVNARLRMVDEIIARHFNGNTNVYVQVLGRNMTTVIETTDIKTYLKSVALSDRILRVNNLGKITINNYPVIKVHEIRK